MPLNNDRAEIRFFSKAGLFQFLLFFEKWGGDFQFFL